MARFIGALILDRLPSNPHGPIKVVRNEFGYVDDLQVKWTVPRGLKTDGASVPLIFQPIIGGAFRPEFLPASVIHDHYCTTKARPWRRTQRVFYEILRFSGVPLLKANAMYYAVLVGSTKWGAMRERVEASGTRRRMRPDTGEDLVWKEGRFDDPNLRDEVSEVHDELEVAKPDASPEEIERMARDRHPEDAFLGASVHYPEDGFPEHFDEDRSQVASRSLSLPRADDPDVEPGDFSRGELAEAFDPEDAVRSRSLKRRFRFPDDMEPGRVFGVDVSHHQGNVDWAALARTGPQFAYVKCTEGATFVDPRFMTNIRGAAAAGLRVGAYHFLSANVPALAQAGHFLKAGSAIRTTNDLPPCLDLEWDPNRRTRKDRWIGHDAGDIVEKALTWLQKVEQELEVVPTIYTNRSWWNERIGAHDTAERLRRYPIWISKYGGFDSGVPAVMPGFTCNLWQFTDSASASGVPSRFDANVVLGSSDLPSHPGQPSEEPDIPLLAEPAAQAALSTDELAGVFSTLRAIFGRLSQSQVDFLNVLVNTSAPGVLRRLTSGQIDRTLTDDEAKHFFEIARTVLAEGHLAQNQVDLLNILLRSSDHDAVRRHLLAH